MAAEIVGKLFGPNGALPSWVNTRLMVYIGMGVAAALVVAGWLLHSSYGSPWSRAMVTVEQWMAGAIWMVFSIVYRVLADA